MQMLTNKVARAPLTVAFSEFKVSVKLPFLRNSNFSGREGIISDMHGCFISGESEKNSIGRKVVVLCGMGGIGKTQIALEYAYRHVGNYTSIFWVDAKNRDTLNASGLQIVEKLIAHYSTRYTSSPDFSRIPTDLGVPGQIDTSEKLAQGALTRVWEIVQNWLSKGGNMGWLMLFDNNDDVVSVDLEELLPMCDWGNIIVTSRDRMVLAYIGGLEIDVPEIGKKSGLELLLKGANKSLGSLTEAGVFSLVHWIQFLVFFFVDKPLKR
jgi:hypothetical protein